MDRRWVSAISFGVICGSVFSVWGWQLGCGVAVYAGASPGAGQAIGTAGVILAIIATGLLIWHRLFPSLELTMNFKRGEVIVRTRPLIARTRFVSYLGKDVREVLLEEEPWRDMRNMTVWALQIVYQNDKVWTLDKCKNVDSLMPLAQDISTCLGLPLHKRAIGA